jgi:hypothetical protein
MQWMPPGSIPVLPGVYRVQVPVPVSSNGGSDSQMFARWTGEYWTSWAVTAEKAARCIWRGPTAGYLWAAL